jgi:hypothetical protein
LPEKYLPGFDKGKSTSTFEILWVGKIVAVCVGAGFSVGGMVMIFGGLDGVGTKSIGDDSLGGGVEHETNNELNKRAIKTYRILLPLVENIHPPNRSTEVGFGNDAGDGRLMVYGDPEKMCFFNPKSGLFPLSHQNNAVLLQNGKDMPSR